MTEQFYTRIRGKVTGPVDLAEVQRQIKRGALSRIHEVSRDGKSWNRAGQYEDLFPARLTNSPATPAVESTPVQPGQKQVAPPSTAVGVNQQELYYEVNGQAVGPLPVAVVESMAINGVIPAEALVWSQTDGTKLSARDHPLLKNITFNDQGAVVVTSTGATKPGRFMSLSGMLLVLVFLSVVAAGIYEANQLTAGSNTTKKSTTGPSVEQPSAAAPSVGAPSVATVPTAAPASGLPAPLPPATSPSP